jgi:hypothetical protein
MFPSALKLRRASCPQAEPLVSTSLQTAEEVKLLRR